MNNKIIWHDRKHFMWFPFSFTKYEIKNAHDVKSLISNLVEEARDKKQIVGKEFFNDAYNLDDQFD